jgi:hypothetical protein
MHFDVIQSGFFEDILSYYSKSISPLNTSNDPIVRQ